MRKLSLHASLLMSLTALVLIVIIVRVVYETRVIARHKPPVEVDTTGWICEHSKIPEIDTHALTMQLLNLTLKTMQFNIDSKTKYEHGLELAYSGHTKEGLKIEKWYNEYAVPHYNDMVDTIHLIRYQLGMEKTLILQKNSKLDF